MQSEVFRPPVASGMKQRYDFPAQRVQRLHCDTFTQVARTTCECQVVELVSATERRRHDVLHFELEVEHTLGRDAEFATMTRSTSYREVGLCGIWLGRPFLLIEQGAQRVAFENLLPPDALHDQALERTLPKSSTRVEQLRVFPTQLILQPIGRAAQLGVRGSECLPASQLTSSPGGPRMARQLSCCCFDRDVLKGGPELDVEFLKDRHEDVEVHSAQWSFRHQPIERSATHRVTAPP
jgi:hypothetical protein